MQSAKPRMQRKFRYNASMHERQRFVHVHVSKELAQKLGIKLRSTSVRRGDTVKVMAGSNKGKTGKVNAVSLRRSTVFIDGINRKNKKGRELQLPISASNVYLIDMDLNDKLRKAKIDALKQKK